MSGHDVIYNDCYGGFGLSDAAEARLSEMGMKMPSRYGEPAWDLISRHDPRLVEVVRDMGSEANGACACLSIEHIKGDVYRICEYDGLEQVIEPEDEEYIHID